jgi:uncharacterized protein
VVTTTSVLLECGNAAARHTYRKDVGDLPRTLLALHGLIEPTPKKSNRRGPTMAGFAGNAGIVDCISFVVMRRLGLSDAFTNDRHFQAAGFTILF